MQSTTFLSCRSRVKIASEDQRLMAMQQLGILKQVTFGSQIAEDEVQQLQNYFVETHQWNQISKGEIDIIRGEKGAGKSAIYSLLSTRNAEFLEKGVLLVAAENPRGATVFKDLIGDPPASEEEFRWLWKVYIVTIIAERMRRHGIRNHHAHLIYGALESAQLLDTDFHLAGLLRATQRLEPFPIRL